MLSKRSNQPAETGVLEEYQKVYAAALRLLARREHSVSELRRKLVTRAFSPQRVEAVIASLLDEDLLSDRRFTEVYVRSRFERGMGPLRIQTELRQRGISGDSLRGSLASTAHAWSESAQRQRIKRFGRALPQTQEERAKQIRFLSARGFVGEQLRVVFGTDYEYP